MKALRLDFLLVCEKGLSELIVRCSESLTSLSLYNVELWSGSLQGPLTGLTASLTVTVFAFGVEYTDFVHSRIRGIWHQDMIVCCLLDEMWSPELEANVAIQEAYR